MAVTPPVSLSKVKDEYTQFTLEKPNNLKAYWRGSVYVPNHANTATISTDPNSLALSQFTNTSMPPPAPVNTVKLTNHSVYATNFLGSGTMVSADIRAHPSGVLEGDGDDEGSFSWSGEWISGTFTASDFEIMATHVSGTQGTGASLNTWLNLGTLRSWTRTQAVQGTSTWTLALQIRRVGTTEILASCNITLTAEHYGDQCVVLESWLDENHRLSHLEEGMSWLTHTPQEGFTFSKVEKVNKPVLVPCVRLTTDTGASLSCSITTPFNLRTAIADRQEGHSLRAPEMLGQEVMVRRGEQISWETVTSVEDIGERWVLPISFGGKSFAAGDYYDVQIFSHNQTKVIR